MNKPPDSFDEELDAGILDSSEGTFEEVADACGGFLLILEDTKEKLVISKDVVIPIDFETELVLT